MASKDLVPGTLYQAIAEVIAQARQQVRQAVNQHMVQAYWHIGRLIVEQEQQGHGVSIVLLPTKPWPHVLFA